MKARLAFGLVATAAALLSGCAMNRNSRVPRNDGNYTQLAANARTYERANGNLDASYPIDLLLSRVATDARIQSPVMVLPQSNPR